MSHLGQHRFPIGRDGLHEGEQVGHAHVVHRRRVQVGREGHAGQRGVAAVAGAVDADALGIGDALLDQPGHAIADVVLHLQAPLAEAGFPEAAAIAGRAPEVHLQHAETPVRQELHFGVVAPAVARPGTAVRIDDACQVLRIAASRQRQVAVDGEAVAALVADRLHARHAGLRQRRVQVGQLAQCVRGGVVQVSRARRAVVVGGDDELVLIAVRPCRPGRSQAAWPSAS